MLHEDDLIEIDGWERDHYGDNICEWVLELEDDEVENDWDAFVLYVQHQDENDYRTSVTVAPEDGTGDLLSADYAESNRTVEEAMAAAREFVDRLNEEYLSN